jgi:hypothetical protein
MSDKDQLRVEDLSFGGRGGFVFVAVPAEHATELQNRLDGLGIGSSLHPAEAGSAAVVHPHCNLSPERIRDLLLGRGWAKRRGSERQE